MKNYLSFGGGVNSTAMMLMLLDTGVEFEAVYVDHGGDWPETIDYIIMLQHKGYKITILKPEVMGAFGDLYKYSWRYHQIPSRRRRWCTDRFKIKVLHRYYEKPCFDFIGIDAGEEHRARMSIDNGIEKRYPLIEEGIDRQGCIDIIEAHGLPVPIKSGCWFCPFQRVGQWKQLRKLHPDLFCKADKLEKRQAARRAEKGKGPLRLCSKPLFDLVQETQEVLFTEMERPPCSCGL